MKIVLLNDNGEIALPVRFATKRSPIEAIDAEVVLVAGSVELVVQLRLSGFCNPIVYLTTDENESDGMNAIKQGADNYVVIDNLSAEGLQDAIQSALTLHNMRCASKRIEQKLDLLSEM